jgi:hypothetical protein
MKYSAPNPIPDDFVAYIDQELTLDRELPQPERRGVIGISRYTSAEEKYSCETLSLLMLRNRVNRSGLASRQWTWIPSLMNGYSLEHAAAVVATEMMRFGQSQTITGSSRFFRSDKPAKVFDERLIYRPRLQVVERIGPHPELGDDAFPPGTRYTEFGYWPNPRRLECNAGWMPRDTVSA